MNPNNDLPTPPADNSNQQNPRDWNLAPSPVKLAVILSALGALVSAFFFLRGVLTMSSPDEIIAAIIFCALSGTYVLVYLWLFNALRQGEKDAYGVQRFVAILGLCACPIGTVLNGYLLMKWSDAEVKEWFGIK